MTARTVQPGDTVYLNGPKGPASGTVIGVNSISGSLHLEVGGFAVAVAPDQVLGFSPAKPAAEVQP